MRFILNFIYFGILYYLIWRFFPVVIETFTVWMDSVYDVVRDLVMLAVDKVSSMISRA